MLTQLRLIMNAQHCKLAFQNLIRPNNLIRCHLITMGSRCTLVLVLIFTPSIFCHSGDPVLYFPPLEVRTMRDQPPIFMGNQQFQTRSPGLSQMQPQQQIFHTSISPPVKTTPPPTRVENDRLEAKNFTFSDLLEAVNNLEENKEHHEASRSAGYGYPPNTYRPPSYGYQQPSYGYQPPPQSYGPYGYNEAAYIPPKPVHHTSSKISLLKPDLSDLVKPVSTKVAGKVSGLIGLVLSLLTGSAPNDLELKGFMDIVVNGVVKPLLLAKGGLKSLISKLTIPVIALVLINLEVLITVWWLWEDCPEPVSPPAPYPYPKPSYGYNYYR